MPFKRNWRMNRVQAPVLTCNSDSDVFRSLATVDVFGATQMAQRRKKSFRVRFRVGNRVRIRVRIFSPNTESLEVPSRPMQKQNVNVNV